ncbi:pyrroline-5-carboxylate reductase [Chloroflexota bacterium]
MKIAFIGGGNMGEAMLAAALEKGLSAPTDISVGEIREERRRQLKERYGVTVTASNKEAVLGKDVVVLAVKPQGLTEVMAELNGSFESVQLVLSIIAGAKISSLCQGLGHNRVVRAMPNTPAQVGAGISAWAATADVSFEQREQARSILTTLGREINCDDEKYLDMATAVSGSGPAYFFLFVEYLVDAAEDIGLTRDTAEELVLQTMLGSARLLQESGKTPVELRRNVTSPGGTTASAMEVLTEGRFAELIKEAVRAAYNRAQELGS